jgi:hypothetical protein
MASFLVAYGEVPEWVAVSCGELFREEEMVKGK